MPCSSCSCLRSGQFAQPVPCCFAGTCFGALAILSRQLLTICVRLALILTPVVTGYVLLLVFGQTASTGRP
jgi:ABC-type molybdate transport system permease subunit